MSKQITIVSFIFLLLIGANSHLLIKETSAQEPQVIPDEAIRLRILANSDSDEDQALKRKVRDAVNAEITEWVAELTSIDAARDLIQEGLPEIEKIVASVLEEENSNQSYTVDYGRNVQFPTKLYGQFLYPAGEYEAILISLGEAEGANWWCVLFPPLCFLDFSTGDAIEASDEEGKDVALEQKTEKEDKKEKKDKEDKVDKDENDEEEVEVKFFLVEFFTSLFS
ncbi:stage II sporulation protein R [Bacillus sp. HNG]|uniref:stage II sporulation protein R n=1 Tax=Bacillus sp. HNG TaxID=2293325 RepID=UPI000E2FC4AD|nr:stage II sporulation protein R [Bacillus sp. HNG]RFB17270.1 stage II sporulation protein R [Bacillus sp. HNG]